MVFVVPEVIAVGAAELALIVDGVAEVEVVEVDEAKDGLH